MNSRRDSCCFSSGERVCSVGWRFSKDSEVEITHWDEKNRLDLQLSSLLGIAKAKPPIELVWSIQRAILVLHPMLQNRPQNTYILIAEWSVKLSNTLFESNLNMDYGMSHRYLGAIQMFQCLIFSELAISANGNWTMERTSTCTGLL